MPQFSILLIASEPPKNIESTIAIRYSRVVIAWRWRRPIALQ